jgi:hypothetical protein
MSNTFAADPRSVSAVAGGILQAESAPSCEVLAMERATQAAGMENGDLRDI